jgi:hypothetical protein
LELYTPNTASFPSRVFSSVPMGQLTTRFLPVDASLTRMTTQVF